MSALLRTIGLNYLLAINEKYYSVEDFIKELDLSLNDLNRFLEGRLILPPHVLKQMSNVLDKPLNVLLNTNKVYSYTECYGSFKDQKNENKILNMIDDYIDLTESVN